MRLAYILTQFPNFTETFVEREIREIRGRGYSVDIYSLKKFKGWDKTQETMTGYKNCVNYANFISLPVVFSNIYWFIRRPINYLRTIYFLASKLGDNPKEVLKALGSLPIIFHFARKQAKDQVEHIHSHFARMGATAAMVCADMLNVPFSFTVHAFDIFLGKDDPYLKEKLAKCKSIACISHYNIQYLREISPEIDQTKFKIVRCGIEPEKIHYIDHEGVPEVIKILSVGSLVEKKGHVYLIQAIKELVTRGQDNILCEIIGGGPDKASIQHLIDQLEVGDHVKLLGPLTQLHVERYLIHCDIFVLACINAKNGDKDGIPVALMEAMAIGRPVISTYVSGIPELVTNELNGCLIHERDVNALSNALSKLINSEEVRKKYGRNATQKISDEFSVKENALKLVEIFEHA